MGSKWEAICPYCGAKYSELRTGLTFASVKEMLWVSSTNPEDWKYKRRNTVLGKWSQIKQQMWEDHIQGCKMLMEESVINDANTET